MKCEDCEYSKETTPAQRNYMYCALFEREMPAGYDNKICTREGTKPGELNPIIPDGV